MNDTNTNGEVSIELAGVFARDCSAIWKQAGDYVDALGDAVIVTVDGHPYRILNTDLLNAVRAAHHDRTRQLGK